MPKYLILLLLPLLMLVSCGDDDSGKSPVQSEFGESSSGEVDSSSSDKENVGVFKGCPLRRGGGEQRSANQGDNCIRRALRQTACGLA